MINRRKEPPKAILFDLDGTLVDSFRAIAQSVNFVRGHHGLPALSEAKVKTMVGNGLRRLLERALPVPPSSADEKLFLAHHPAVLGKGSRLLAGVRQTMKSLAERGCKLGVCSNKPLMLTRKLLIHLELRDLMSVILGPEKVAKPKPAPDMLLLAMQRLRVKPEQTLFVGDMTIDTETARAAGVQVWIIPSGSQNGTKVRSSKPDRVMKRFAELLEVVPQNSRRHRVLADKSEAGSCR